MRAISLLLVMCSSIALITWGAVLYIDKLPVDIMAGTLAGSSALLLGTALCVNLGLFWLFALRWQLMLPENLPVPLRHLVYNRLAGFTISYLTPGNQIGGEAVQIALIGKRGELSLRQATEAVLLERGVDFIANGITIFLLSISFGIELFPALQWSTGSIWLILLLTGVVVSAVWYAKDKVNWLTIRQRFNPPVLFQLTACSLLIWLLFLLEFWLLFAAIGLFLPATQLISLFIAVRVAFWVPLPVPAAAGIMEGALLLAANLCSIPTGDALAVAVLIRLRDLLLIVGGLIVFWMESGRWLLSAESGLFSADRGV